MNDSEWSHGKLALSNRNAEPLRLITEPWGSEVIIAPGRTLEMSFSGPPGGRLEIEVRQGQLTVYGWEGATLEAVNADGGD